MYLKPCFLRVAILLAVLTVGCKGAITELCLTSKEFTLEFCLETFECPDSSYSVARTDNSMIPCTCNKADGQSVEVQVNPAKTPHCKRFLLNGVTMMCQQYDVSPHIGQCYECEAGYIVYPSTKLGTTHFGTTCAMCGDGCSACSEIPSNCTACLDGYTLSASNTCILHAPDVSASSDSEGHSGSKGHSDSGGSPSSAGGDSPGTSVTDDSEKKGIPWWVWVIVGVGAALIVGVVVFVVVYCVCCKKKKDRNVTTPSEVQPTAPVPSRKQKVTPPTDHEVVAVYINPLQSQQDAVAATRMFPTNPESTTVEDNTDTDTYSHAGSVTSEIPGYRMSRRSSKVTWVLDE
ncbi:hypothetical protein AGDE_16105 [Angomonas deanei]|nr:hypothetical protein AGDE_16105 [Angomonas deanei]|eukprot:EPY17698.1 hypothetical protein AGDE_16105 [Angomonas deanei]